jgi:hypothetical protein
LEYQSVEILYKSHPEVKIKRPQNLDVMLGLARTLSGEIPFLRTDFYVVGEKIFVGELTFYPGDGY